LEPKIDRYALHTLFQMPQFSWGPGDINLMVGIDASFASITAHLDQLPDPLKKELKNDFQVLIDRVAELERIEVQCRAQEELFRCSLDGLLEGFALFSAIQQDGQIIDFRYLYINEAGCRLNQMRPEQLIGRTLLEVLPNHKETGLFSRYVQVVETGQPLNEQHLVYEDVYGTGQRLKRSFNVRAVKVSDGMAVVWDDVTSQRQIETELRTSQQRLQALVDNLPVGVVFTDAQGQFIISNPANQRLFGDSGTTGDARGPAGRYTLHHPDGSPFLEQELPLVRALQEGLQTRDVEILIRPENGEEVVILANTSPVCEPGGAVSGAITAMQNITERKRMENEIRRKQAELKSSEERFRLASRAVPGMFYDWDLTTDLVFRTEGIYDLLGINQEEIDLEVNWWLDRIHPEDGKNIQARLEEILSGGEDMFDAEYRMRHADGHWVYLWDRSFIVRNSKQQAVRMVGSVTDITARKVYEASLQESEQREREKAAELEAIMDAVPAIVWISRDSESRLIDGNRAAFEVLQMKPGENLSKTAPEHEIPRHFRTMRHGHEIPATELPVQLAASKGIDVHDYEFDVAFSDGSVIHLVGNATPLFDEQGRPRGAVSAFIDITARKQAEQALYESDLRFRIALANAPIMVYTMDHNLRYTWVYNPSDYPLVSEIIGRRQEDLNPAPEAVETIALKRQVIETGTGIQQEIISNREGETRYFILNLEPIRDSSELVIGLTGAVLDVTRQRRLEAERQEHLTSLEVQRRLMEYRESERQEIAREIHDGPIQTLVSTLFTLQVSKSALTDPMIQIELEQIGMSLKSAVRELREVVNELRPPSLLRFGLSRAIRIHMEDLRDRHPDLLTELELTDDEGLLPESLCLTLFRIYQESMNNIIRHSQATHTWVSLTFAENQINLEVRDDGKGFNQQDDLASQTESGHFGLAGMKERAQAAGGDLIITSQTGVGTIVHVTVPWKIKPTQ
jgi:PAS domain S-box-containing protein